MQNNLVDVEVPCGGNCGRKTKIRLTYDKNNELLGAPVKAYYQLSLFYSKFTIHLNSSDNGATWDNATWSGSDHLTGIAFGNNTFIGAASENVIRSTDKGLNWITGSEINVYDVAFGDSTFIGSMCNWRISV